MGDLEEDSIELKIPDVAFKLFDFHISNGECLKDVSKYTALSWYKIFKEYYKNNFGDTLKVSKEDIKLLTDLYSNINSEESDTSQEILSYVYILIIFKSRLPSDKSLGNKFAYDNASLNMEILYWLFQLFTSISTASLEKGDTKATYALLKQSNAILSYLVDNYDKMFKAKLHNLPKIYSVESFKFFHQLINSLQQEMFIKITLNNTKSKPQYSLLSKMAYQVYLFYNDEKSVNLFKTNRFNNFYKSDSSEETKSGSNADFFTELSNMINIKKSLWLIITIYYHCLNLYLKGGKYGEPLAILKTFLNNYSFNENHQDVMSLKNQMISFLNVIKKDNDFIYHEDVDIIGNDYKTLIEGKISPLNSNKFVPLDEIFKELQNDLDLNAKIDKLFQHILNLKTLELESIFTAVKEDFCKEQMEDILTSNMELVTLIDYNQLEVICDNKNRADESEDLNLSQMHQIIGNSNYSDINAIRKKIDYLRQKAVELTKNAQTDNQIALQKSLQNAIENDDKLFENIKLYKNEIDLIRNYDNLTRVYETLKQKEEPQIINLIDDEDPSKALSYKLKERLSILKEIQYQRNLLMKKFKPNSGSEEESIKEHNDLVKLILSTKDTVLLKEKFNDYIAEKYSFESSTITALSKQQNQISNEIESLLYELQTAQQNNDSKRNINQEFYNFKQKLSDAFISFQSFEQNCKECISYYNSLFELIPQHF